MDTSARAPIVAGTFYPANADVLRASIEAFFESGIPDPGRRLAKTAGLIAPHAGYPYSGAVAAAGYGAVAERGRPDVVVLLGANHSGLGAPMSLSSHTSWETPLGRSPVEGHIVTWLVGAGLPMADAAFAREHSIEVQLPFIQAVWDTDLPIVPICVMSAPRASLRETVEAIATAIGETRALIVASSDFTHYETDETARELDRLALEPIIGMDADAFDRICRDRGLSICGAGAIEVLLDLCRRLGIERGELLQYATSGDTTGDRTAVVGYASVLFMTEAT
jgi:AmmeMemoRadiSam system protein B